MKTHLLLCSLLLTATLPAEVPHRLNYQGRVSVSGQNFTGNGQFKFALINDAATAAYWKNDGPAGNILVPPFQVTLPVENGHYSVQLGDTTLANMQALPAGVFTDHSDVKLRVWFSDGVKGFQLLTPDQKIAAVGYAVIAESVSDGAITAAKLAPGAAKANLDAGGLAGVASHGVILSDRENDANLLAAGYIATGTMETKAADYWRQLAPAQTRRRSHVAVSDGIYEGFVVWGGFTQAVAGGAETLSGTGERYDLDTDTWSPMSATNAPSARSLHTGVRHYAANQMIVWGGSGTPAYLGDGGRYDNDSNTWTPIPVSPAISARRYHTAVVIGDEMIVFGGETSAGVYTGTGARYNLTTNTWTQLPIGPGSPGARAAHTAVASSNGKMIIWGGLNGGVALNTGSLYDPVANTWTALSTVGAPAARQSHYAVGTNQGDGKMLIWGGIIGGTPVATGALYDVGTNTWGPLGAPLAPSARTGDTLTYVGKYIVQWGGQTTGATYPSDAHTYDYVGNDWIPSTAYSPLEGRQAHSAVWNGHEAFVFGGQNASGDLKDLWLWQPQRTLYLYTHP